MKDQEVARWKEVARLMCFGLWPDITPARKEKLWAQVEPFIDFHADKPVDGWQDEYGLNSCFDDWFGEYAVYKWVRGGRWPVQEMDVSIRYFFNQLRCVVRASVNMIFENDMAVMGFSVGDVKQMFGGQMPSWFLKQYEGLTNESPEETQIVL